MDRHADFSDYAAARWTASVRSGVVLGCSVEDAQDLAQTTLLRCYSAWRRVQNAENRDAYVYRILLNLFRDSRRRRWWGEQAPDDLPDVVLDDSTTAVGPTDTIHCALGDLGLEDRQVVVLRHLAHFTERETAALLAIAPGTVKSRLARALDQLAGSSHLVEGNNRD